MTITTYDELKTAIGNWAQRTDMSSFADEIIDLAEADLNRKVPFSEADANLTATISSREIDISALNVSEPVALWLTTEEEDDQIPLKRDGSFPYFDTSGYPGFAALDDNNDRIDFDRPADQAYTFRFRYRGRYALSDAAPTNQLLTDHPDAYLLSCMYWAGFLDRNPALMAMEGKMERAISDAATYFARRYRGTLTVDPALVLAASGRYDWQNDT